MCWFLFLVTLRALTCNILKKGLQHRQFPVNIVKFLRTPFSQNTSGRLRLKLEKYLFNGFFLNVDWIYSNFIDLKLREIEK